MEEEEEVVAEDSVEQEVAAEDSVGEEEEHQMVDDLGKFSFS